MEQTEKENNSYPDDKSMGAEFDADVVLGFVFGTAWNFKSYGILGIGGGRILGCEC